MSTPCRTSFKPLAPSFALSLSIVLCFLIYRSLFPRFCLVLHHRCLSHSGPHGQCVSPCLLSLTLGVSFFPSFSLFLSVRASRLSFALYLSPPFPSPSSFSVTSALLVSILTTPTFLHPSFSPSFWLPLSFPFSSCLFLFFLRCNYVVLLRFNYANVTHPSERSMHLPASSVALHVSSQPTTAMLAVVGQFAPRLDRVFSIVLRRHLETRE